MRCSSCGYDNRLGRRYCGGCGEPLSESCPQCGRTNEPGERFCGDCGTPLTGTAASGGAGAFPSDERRHIPPGPAAPAATPPLPAAFAAGRYRVQRFLGEGGRKRVYLALDTSLAREVAVAEVKTEGLDATGRARVRQEAQAMAHLGDHPGIVTVHDIFEDEGRQMIVSQYMPGGSLADRLAAAEGKPLPVEAAVGIALDACAALAHVHGNGVVHRDVKPANLWLTDDGRAKLGDFGLAWAAEAPRLTVEGMALGTVAYMPPEQAVGRDADARSDLYSLGAVLYEMLTCRPPFVGDDAVAVISQHLNTAPVPPTWHNRAVPPSLEALVLELLAKSPDDRPATATAVAERLRAVSATPVPSTEPPAAPLSPAPARRRLAWRFVGRHDELGALRAAVDGAVAGRGSLVMVVGEPGIGKTRLTEEAGVYAGLRGARTLVGRCYEGETAVPYLPFVEAIRQYAAEISPDELRSELGDAAPDVAKLVSDIRQRVGGLPEPSPTSPEQERHRLFEGVTSFLVNASRTRPVYLVLDDLHWADRQSLLLLRHLARRLEGSRLVVAGTYRDVELDRRHPLAEVLAELRREPTYERVLLRGLSAGEVGSLLEAAAEQSLEEPLRELAPTLHRETEGNPFFVAEVVRHLVWSGRIVNTDGRWRLSGEVADLGIPEGVREVIGRRLSRLSDDANHMLSHAAVLGREFEFAVLARMVDFDDDRLLVALEEALDAQLVVEREHRGAPAYAFTHALVQETLYDELSLPRKQRMHLRAGEAIEAEHERDTDRVAPSLAAHYRLAGAAADAEKTIRYSLAAASSAAGLYAWDEAAVHLEAAIELMAEDGSAPAARAALLVQLGDLMFVSGVDYQRGVRALEEALALYEEADDAEGAALAHSRLGRALSSFPDTADLRRAMAHFRAAEKVLAPGGDRPGLGYVYSGMAMAAVFSLDAEAGVDAAARAMAIGERLGNERLWANGAACHAWLLWARGQNREATALLDRVWDIGQRHGQSFTMFWAATFGAGMAQGLRDPAPGVAWLKRALAEPWLEQAPRQQRLVADWAAALHLLRGDLAKAREAMTGGAAINEVFRCQLDVLKGRWDEAERGLQRDAERSAQSGDALNHANAVAHLAWLAWLSGDLADAVAHAERVLAATPTLPVALEVLARHRAVIAHAEAGERDAARSHLDALLGIIRAGGPWSGLAGLAAAAEAVLAAGDGDTERAERSFAQAVTVFSEHEVPFEEAEALHQWGRARLAAGDAAGAVEKLNAALDRYRRHGAGPQLAERVLADKLRAQGLGTVAADPQASIDLVASQVAGERPDLRAHAAPDGTVTIVFTDLESSTAINERLGDRRWAEVLSAHHELVRRCVAAHGGFEVKSQGDGFMLVFPSARRAIDCAMAIQSAAASATVGDESLRVRVGIHTGEAVRQGDDFFGRHVNLAARVGAAAQGGEVLVTAVVRELATGAEVAFDEGRDVTLKGFDQPYRLYAVTGQAGPVTAAP